MPQTPLPKPLKDGYRLFLRITNPEFKTSEIIFDNAIINKNEGGILVRFDDCNRNILAWYPINWAVEVIKIEYL